jgi:Wzt C-terminal domain/Sulfotransferase family
VRPVSRGLLYLHIPKTAGTTFASFLSRNVGFDNCSDGLNQIKWHDALARYSDYKLISGHLDATIGDQLPPDRDSLVILREPLDRFLSNFFFQSSDVSDTPLSFRSAISNIDLNSYIETLTSSERETLNLQTAMLYPLGTSGPPPHSWEAKVAAAKRALDNFQMVGIQSDVEDFAAMVASRMGWAIAGDIGYANVTSRRIAADDLTNDQKRRLRGLLEPDSEVYAHARSRFFQDRRNVLRLAGASDAVRATGAEIPSSTPGSSESAANSALGPVGGTIEYGNRHVEILAVEATGELSGPGNMLTGELITLTVRFQAHQPAEDFTVGFSIKDRRGGTLFGSNTRLEGARYEISAGTYTAVFQFLNRFGEGSYFIDVELHKGRSLLDEAYHSRRSAARFDVVGRTGAYFEGALLLDVDASISPVGDARVSTERTYDEIAPTLFVGRLSPPLREFCAQLRQLGEIHTLRTSEGLLVGMEITNVSNSKWPSTGKRAVHLSYRWHRADGAVIVANGLRTRLPEDVEPGASVMVRGLLRAPDIQGRMTLAWDLVQEHVRWFSDADSKCAISSAVLVT